MAQQYVTKTPKIALLDSIRSIGYTFNSALADIVDNCIAAKATKIDIYLVTHIPAILICDNGIGMSYKKLDVSMELGTLNSSVREENDLGRFGLGMKTASFSQCKKLNVTTKQNGQVSSMCWDLDVVVERNDWVLIVLPKEDIYDLPYVQEFFKKNSSGTIVQLSNFDRVKNAANDLVETLKSNLAEASKYLALVFHKFLSSGKISISINGNPIKAVDPFLLKKSESLRSETINMNTTNGKKAEIKVLPHILPFVKNLLPEDFEILGENVSTSIRNNQGFYIYRGDRLIIWGTWLGLSPNNELYKNARVEVNIPNSLDDIWEVDVKKASASIPEKLAKRLRAHIKSSTEESKRVIAHRVRKERPVDGFEPVWSIEELEDSYSIKINKKIHLYKLLQNKLGSDKELLDIFIHDIEVSIPKNTIYKAMAESRYSIIDNEDESVIKQNALKAAKMFKDTFPDNYIDFVESMFEQEPYCDHMNILDEIKGEL